MMNILNFKLTTTKINYAFTAGLSGVIILILLTTLTPKHIQATPLNNKKIQKTSKTVIQVKIKNNSNTELSGAKFSGDSSTELNEVLAISGAVNVKPLFKTDKATLKNQHRELKDQGHNVADLSKYYRILVNGNIEAATIANQLKLLPMVEEAYPEPLPAPAPASPSFVSKQSYRSTAPTGINSVSTVAWPGGQGENTSIADIEYSWNTAHEDLSKARVPGAFVANGTYADYFNNNSHGTAVLGILSGDNNAYGVTGIAPKSNLKLVNSYSSDYGWDIAGGVYTAANNLAAGDIMLIEQQVYGPTAADNDFVPAEWVPSVYDAILYASAKGIIVIETAGNGAQNLDNTSLYGAPFPNGKADSGAIIVGAGATCPSSTLTNSRRFDSTYGTRVNVQGWGECVTTTGYDGSLWNGGSNALYTSSFAGTSSAGAVVAGSAAVYTSVYKKLNGVPPSVKTVKNTLMTTGTPQNKGTGTLTGNIGPLPNLAKALPTADFYAPKAATNLYASLNTSNKVYLKWSAASDNAGIKEYRIYRDNILVKTVSGSTLSFTDTSVTNTRTYSYKVVAADLGGKVSPASNIVTIKTR